MKNNKANPNSQVTQNQYNRVHFSTLGTSRRREMWSQLLAGTWWGSKNQASHESATDFLAAVSDDSSWESQTFFRNTGCTWRDKKNRKNLRPLLEKAWTIISKNPEHGYCLLERSGILRVTNIETGDTQNVAL